MIAYVIGIILLCEAGLLIFPTVVGIICSERSVFSFLITIALCAAAGLLLVRLRPDDRTLYARDGFVIVSLAWIVMSLFGALPFFFSRQIPSYLDAVFETVSGFTTTGASILTDVEALSRCMIFWRSFTHWVGGMGVLVFVMAVLPLASGGSDLHLMRAESPGPDVGKLVPKSTRTAKILYSIYFVMTVVEIILLLAGGMSAFDAFTLSFGTAGTGGFAVLNSGIASYSPYCQIIITVFMTLFGVNFNVFFLIVCGKIKDALKSEELRAYLGIMATAVIIVTINIASMFDTLGEALRASAFQISSVMTTTGYSTVDFDQWPTLSKMIMLAVMCIGASAGSTGGGFKVSRLMLLLKDAKRELKRLVNPRSVSVVTFEGKRVDVGITHSANVYFTIYVMIFVISVLIVAFDKISIVSNITGVIATLNNIGPGLDQVGPSANYSICSWLTKTVFIADMLLGRLEIFPLILLFSRPIHSAKHHKKLI